METTDRKQHLLNEYAEGTLTGQDLADFRHLAQTDPDFRRDAELERRISQALEQGHKEQFK